LPHSTRAQAWTPSSRTAYSLFVEGAEDALRGEQTLEECGLDAGGVTFLVLPEPSEVARAAAAREESTALFWGKWLQLKQVS
jgi:hypothetical protein